MLYLVVADIGDGNTYAYAEDLLSGLALLRTITLKTIRTMIAEEEDLDRRGTLTYHHDALTIHEPASDVIEWSVAWRAFYGWAIEPYPWLVLQLWTLHVPGRFT